MEELDRFLREELPYFVFIYNFVEPEWICPDPDPTFHVFPDPNL
jgi:hypothetical protein